MHFVSNDGAAAVVAVCGAVLCTLLCITHLVCGRDYWKLHVARAVEREVDPPRKTGFRKCDT